MTMIKHAILVYIYIFKQTTQKVEHLTSLYVFKSDPVQVWSHVANVRYASLSVYMLVMNLAALRLTTWFSSPRFLCRPTVFCSTCWSRLASRTKSRRTMASRTKSRRTAEESRTNGFQV